MASVEITREDSIAVVKLNRPERRNALSLEMMLALDGSLKQLGADRSVRAIILSAEGAVFCSGHDLKEMTGRTVGDYRQLFSVCRI